MPWQLWNKLYDRLFIEKIGLTFPEIRSSADMYAFAVVFANLDRFYLIDNPAYFYTTRSKSITALLNRKEHKANILAANKEIYNYLNKNKLLSKGKLNVFMVVNMIKIEEDREFYEDTRKLFLEVKRRGMEYYSDYEKYLIESIINGDVLKLDFVPIWNHWDLSGCRDDYDITRHALEYTSLKKIAYKYMIMTRHGWPKKHKKTNRAI
jgi:hypothetical protein